MSKKQKKLRGFWQQIPSTTVSEILCHSDLDFVCLDTEHGVFNEETIFRCIQTITLSGKKVFIRVTEANKTLVRHYLDAGVDGLIFSTMEDCEYYKKDIYESSDHNDLIDELNFERSYSREVVNQCKFPSAHGRRGYGLTRDNFWGEKPRKKDPLLIAQIESKLGAEQFHRFGYAFDYYLIGPYDLSSDLGIPGDFDNPIYKEKIQEIKDLVPAEKLGYHIVKDIAKQLPDLNECGILAFSMDTLMLINGIKEIEDIVAIDKIK
jgi:2-keto-3-deoxy-L-rhamnonate aldolase RhmA